MADVIEFWKCIMTRKIPIKDTPWNIVGDSWAARHTTFYIPELGIFLDIGKESEQHPTHIFISHAHCDHTKALASHLLEPKGTPIVVVPKPSANDIRNLVNSYHKSTKHNANSIIKWRLLEVSIPIDKDSSVQLEMINPTKSSNKLNVSTITETIEIPEPLFMNEFMKIKNINFKIELFKCTHSIPTTGYGFIEMRSKLDDKYVGMPQEEIDSLSRSGVNVTKIVEKSHFCYLGDTTHHVFYLDKKCTVFNPHIEKYGTVIVECTFLFDEDIKQAKDTKHMHWNNLRIYIQSHPNINFILSHFSARYNTIIVKDFFLENNLPNVFIILNDQEEYWFNKLLNKLSSNDIPESIKSKLSNTLNFCTECTKSKEKEKHDKSNSHSGHEPISNILNKLSHDFDDSSSDNITDDSPIESFHNLDTSDTSDNSDNSNIIVYD